VALDESLAVLVAACSQLGRELAPFLPDLAGRVLAACGDSAGNLPQPQPVFPRIEPAVPGDGA
jgi:methionyl-tRNA synthetase